jgi:hypothetical protein
MQAAEQAADPEDTLIAPCVRADRLAGDVRHDVLAVGADGVRAAGESGPLQMIKQGMHGRRPRAARAADDVTVDYDRARLILHPH